MGKEPGHFPSSTCHPTLLGGLITPACSWLHRLSPPNIVITLFNQLLEFWFQNTLEWQYRPSVVISYLPDYLGVNEKVTLVCVGRGEVLPYISLCYCITLEPGKKTFHIVFKNRFPTFKMWLQPLTPALLIWESVVIFFESTRWWWYCEAQRCLSTNSNANAELKKEILKLLQERHGGNNTTWRCYKN